MTFVQLRGRNSLTTPFNGRKDLPEPPRALRSLAQIVEGDLCHRCGSCVGICPTRVLAADESGFPVVANMSACTDCDLCVKVCPGDEFDAPKVFKEKFGDVYDPSDTYGNFETSYITYSTDEGIRSRGTSGGFITALLLYLLESKIIDGAALVTADGDEIWKGKPLLARTPEEIKAAAKSKYAIVPTNTVFDEIRSKPGRYALVGLPCQIHGYYKAAELNKQIKESVVLTIGLLCHAAIEHEAIETIWESIPETDKRSATRFLYRHGKHAGAPFLIHQNGREQPLLFPEAKGHKPDAIEMMNILYRLYTPARCFTCYDSMAEFADIAVGDPWMIPPSDSINFKDGYSYFVCRTKKSDALVKEAEIAGRLKLIPLQKDHARTSNLAMGIEKRRRAFRLLNSRRHAGLPVPEYGFDIPKSHGIHLATEINLLTHTFSFIRRGRKSLLKFLLSPKAYWLWWLNYQQRKARYALKKRVFRKKQRIQAEQEGGI